MVGQHPLAELAPRDVVAKAIMKEMAREGSDHVWVDGRDARRRDLAGPVPDHPAQLPPGRHQPGHRPDPGGPGLPLLLRRGTDRSSTGPPTWPGCTPAVRSPRPACTAPTGWPPTRCSRVWSSPAGSPPGSPRSCRRGAGRRTDPRTPGLVDPTVVPALQQVMSRYAGGLRDAAGLDRCLHELAGLAAQDGAEPGLEAWEATNLLTVATAVAASARRREESRGRPLAGRLRRAAGRVARAPDRRTRSGRWAAAPLRARVDPTRWRRPDDRPIAGWPRSLTGSARRGWTPTRWP